MTALVVGDTVCPEGCCRAVSDPGMAWPDTADPNGVVYPRPMFEVLPDQGFPVGMTVTAADYDLPGGILL